MKRFAALLALLLISGCSKAPGLELQRLDPKAPAATGLPARPAAGEPTPLQGRTPFGFYTQYPSVETLEALAKGTLSPDNRFRSAMTEQGVWVTRLDGSWIWQVEVAPPVAPANPPTATQTTPPATTPQQPVIPRGSQVAGPIVWTPRSTLLLRDNVGTWLEADPETAQVTPLPYALQGKESITFSPDGKQVLYYVTGKTGRQLWVAQADGTKAQFQGENVAGHWDSDGKLIVTKLSAPPTQAPPDQNLPNTATRE